MHALLRVRLDPAAAKRFNRRLDKLVDDVRAAETPDGESVGPRRRVLPVGAALMRRFLPGGLWRHRDFRNLWAAETVSQLGSQVSQIALPLVAILVLDASAFEVALLGVIEFAPFILISLPAGVWVDRLRRKPILVAADVGRALLLASIPVAYWLDVLTIWQLYVVGFVGRLPHRLLRRLLPVVPPLARRARPADRGQLEARDQPLGRAARRARAGRRARRAR